LTIGRPKIAKVIGTARGQGAVKLVIYPGAIIPLTSQRKAREGNSRDWLKYDADAASVSFGNARILGANGEIDTSSKADSLRISTISTRQCRLLAQPGKLGGPTTSVFEVNGRPVKRETSEFDKIRNRSVTAGLIAIVSSFDSYAFRPQGIVPWGT